MEERYFLWLGTGDAVPDGYWRHCGTVQLAPYVFHLIEIGASQVTPDQTVTKVGASQVTPHQ